MTSIPYGRWLVGRQNVKRELDEAGQPLLRVRCPHKYEGTVHGDKDLLIYTEPYANWKPCDWTMCPRGKDHALRVETQRAMEGKA